MSQGTFVVHALNGNCFAASYGCKKCGKENCHTCHRHNQKRGACLVCLVCYVCRLDNTIEENPFKGEPLSGLTERFAVLRTRLKAIHDELEQLETELGKKYG